MPNQSKDAFVLRALLVGIAFLIAVACQAADSLQPIAENKGCALKEIASIDLLGENANIVPLKFGASSILLMLNISDMTSVILSSVVERAKWPTYEAQKGLTIGDVAIKRAVNLDGLELGKVRYTRLSFLIYPTTGAVAGIDGVPLIGSLGMNAFGTVDFELDIAHRKLRLFSHNECGQNVVYWTDSYASAPMHKGEYGEVYFDMELDGKKVEATFDSQNQVSQLHTDVSKKLYNFDEKSYGNEKVEQKDGSAAYYYRAMKMTAPGLAITNERVQLKPPPGHCSVRVPLSKRNATGYQYCQGVHPLTLGLPVLAKLRIYFAMKDEVIYYTSADATH